MTICIPVEFKPQGGGQYFLRSFATYLEAHGHTIERTVEARSDILFTNHWLVPLGDVLRAVRRHPDVRVVHRIDGAAQDYGRDSVADRRQRAVNRLADLTVFQSHYCRWSTREKFRVIAQDGPVIHNPVDVQVFTPDGKRLLLDGTPRVVSVSWSTNPRKGAASIYATAAANPEVTFYLCGRFLAPPALPNLRLLGVLDRDHLAGVLRSCDALLTYSENEACPNHVIEALASGCPVLYRDSGAMREVIEHCGLTVEPESFAGGLNQLRSAWPEWSRRARARALACFHPDVAFGRYADELAAARSRPPRAGLHRRQARAWLGAFSPRSWAQRLRGVLVTQRTS